MKMNLVNVIEYYHCAHGVLLTEKCDTCQHEAGGEERVLPRRGVERHTLNCDCWECKCVEAPDGTIASFTALRIRRALGAITLDAPEKWAAWVLYLLQGMESLAHVDSFPGLLNDLLEAMVARLNDGQWPALKETI